MSFERYPVLACVRAGGLEIVVSAADEAEELVKATFSGMEPRRIAQMPLAHDAAYIAGVGEDLGQQRFTQGQALSGAEFGIPDVAEAMLVAPGEQPCP